MITTCELGPAPPRYGNHWNWYISLIPIGDITRYHIISPYLAAFATLSFRFVRYPMTFPWYITWYIPQFCNEYTYIYVYCIYIYVCVYIHRYTHFRLYLFLFFFLSLSPYIYISQYIVYISNYNIVNYNIYISLCIYRYIYYCILYTYIPITYPMIYILCHTHDIAVVCFRFIHICLTMVVLWSQREQRQFSWF